ncbi:hypothetical protein QYM36_015420 [Artemia franciscana]|uniref:Uncharacterized protein n=1 Tax=Artemia franciscana TaxID=6661 RepID=A0AA88HEY7_ARTSF|nr:hypothetical protein QYM36_015420 [Artemia franciscana]
MDETGVTTVHVPPKVFACKGAKQEEGISESYAQDASTSSVKKVPGKGCKRVESIVLTDTLTKNQLMADMIEREKKKKKSEINKKQTENVKNLGKVNAGSKKMSTCSDPADCPLRALAKARTVLSYISNSSSEEGDKPEYCESEDSLTMDVEEEGIGSMQNAEILVEDYLLVALQKKSLLVHFVAEVLLVDSFDVEVKFWKHWGNEKSIPTDEVSFVMKPDWCFASLNHSGRATLLTSEDIRPHPKAPPRKNFPGKGRKRVKSIVLTDTLTKNQLMANMIEREKKMKRSEINKKQKANVKNLGKVNAGSKKMSTCSDPADCPLRALAKARTVLSYISNSSSEEGDKPEYCESEDSLTMDVEEEGIGSMQNAEILVEDYLLVALQKKSLLVHFVAEVLLIDSFDVEVKFWKHWGNEKSIPTDEVSFVMKPDWCFASLNHSGRATLLTPEDIRPHPKALPRKKVPGKGRKRVESIVLTDTLTKNQHMANMIEREKKMKRSEMNKKQKANVKNLRKVNAGSKKMSTSSDPADCPLRALAKARKVLSYMSNSSSEEGDKPEYCESEDSLTMDVEEERIGSMQNAEILVEDYLLVALQKKSLLVHFVAEVLLIDSLDVEVKFWKHWGNEKSIPTDEVSFVMKPDWCFAYLNQFLSVEHPTNH